MWIFIEVRLDLVLNDFVASALKNNKIDILSDGSPFRPLIHVKDMARAIDWSTSRNEKNENQNLFINTGSNDWNYKIKDLGEKTSIKISNCELSINKNASPDKRSYKVDFSKFNSLAKNYKCLVSLDDAIDDLLRGLKNCTDLSSNFRESNYMRLNYLNSLIDRLIINKDLRLLI